MYGDAYELERVGTVYRTYNENGQLVADENFTYQWDTAGNLNRIYSKSTGLQVAEYRYDDQNRRIEQVIDGEWTKFVYDGKTNQVAAELDGYDRVKKYYTWSAAGHLESIEENGKLYYPVRNGQGDIVEILDEQGATVAEYAYDAFGNIVHESGQTDISPYRYAGYRYDEVSNLYYLNARYYQPEVGQFLSTDEMSELPDYTYGANNPLSFHDPNGEFILNAISAVSDAIALIKEPSWENVAWLASNFVPSPVPISMAFKAGKWVKNAAKAGTTPKNIGNTDVAFSGAKQVQAGTSRPESPTKYDVGLYNEIKGANGLDAHHVGQKAVMRKFVQDYDSNTAPAILVPKVGHTIKGPNGIVSRSTKGISNPRQLLARDITELRRVYPDIPNSQLQSLINLNKQYIRW